VFEAYVNDGNVVDAFVCERYVVAAFVCVRYVAAAEVVESLLLNVFQSVAERVPVAFVPDKAIVRACPEIVSPFILFASVTSPLFVPERFDADIFPVNVAPASFAYVDEAVEVET